MSKQRMKQHQAQQKEQARRSPTGKPLPVVIAAQGCLTADAIVTEFTQYLVSDLRCSSKELYANIYGTSSPHEVAGESSFSTTIKADAGQSVRASGPRSKPTSPSPAFPDRHVWLDGVGVLQTVSQSAPPLLERTSLLADDANRHLITDSSR